MADHIERSPQPPNFHGILGISKSASLGDIAKAYRSMVTKWHPDRNATNKSEAQAKLSGINEAYKALKAKKREEADLFNQDNYKSQENSHQHHRSTDFSDDEELVISGPQLVSTTSNRVTPMGTPRKLSEGSSHRKTPSIPTPRELHGHGRSLSGAATPTSPTSPGHDAAALFSKIMSRKHPTPIIFSQTTARKKANPIEKKLLCTLEELSTGCVKRVKITRDVLSNEGLIVQEEEILKIKVKPGWRKGTQITFEGKGDEKPGMHPADIIFVIDEKRHPLYKREADDLELGVEIPLVKALTGCIISVPLLGGEETTVSVLDDVIFHGYEKRIPGQGMPISNEDDKRGDLVLKFLVEFPTELSDEQISVMVNALGECP